MQTVHRSDRPPRGVHARSANLETTAFLCLRPGRAIRRLLPVLALTWCACVSSKSLYRVLTEYHATDLAAAYPLYPGLASSPHDPEGGNGAFWSPGRRYAGLTRKFQNPKEWSRRIDVRHSGFDGTPEQVVWHLIGQIERQGGHVLLEEASGQFIWFPQPVEDGDTPPRWVSATTSSCVRLAVYEGGKDRYRLRLTQLPRAAVKQLTVMKYENGLAVGEVCMRRAGLLEWEGVSASTQREPRAEPGTWGFEVSALVGQMETSRVHVSHGQVQPSPHGPPLRLRAEAGTSGRERLCVEIDNYWDEGTFGSAMTLVPTVLLCLEDGQGVVPPTDWRTLSGRLSVEMDASLRPENVSGEILLAWPRRWCLHKETLTCPGPSRRNRFP